MIVADLPKLGATIKCYNLAKTQPEAWSLTLIWRFLGTF